MDHSRRLSDIYSFGSEALHIVAQNHDWPLETAVKNYRRYKAPKNCQTSIKYFEDAVIISTPHLRLGFWQKNQECVQLYITNNNGCTEKDIPKNFGIHDSNLCHEEKDIITILVKAGFDKSCHSPTTLKRYLFK